MKAKATVGQPGQGQGLASGAVVVRQADMAAMVERTRSDRAAVQVRGADRVARKASIAGGAQAAVVKLASYASGSSRVGALGQYLSQGGEVQLERDTGEVIEGREEIGALAKEWSEAATQRKPSDDVLMFHVHGVAGRSGAERAKLTDSLGDALKGHRFAWRVEGEGETARIEVVVTAASSEKTEQGRSIRISNTPKSLDVFEQRLKQSLGESARFEERGFAHGVEGAARYLSRLTRGGQHEVQLSTGKPVQGHEQNLGVARSWKRDMRSREQRDVVHVILSAKPGTGREAFVEAARATLQGSFAGHEYAFALHENRSHLHVHAMVRMESRDGQKLDPKIQDLQQWRQALAQEARQRHVQMEATSRFDQAHAPGYKLKDIRRVERGVATEAVRRRVEVVQARAVHIPTRREGIEHARIAVNEWRRLSLPGASNPVMALSEPSQQADHIRLYRFERQGVPASRAPVFTMDRATAEGMSARSGGQLIYMDMPKERFAALEASGEIRGSQRHAGRDFALSSQVAREAKLLEPVQAQVLAFTERAETAARQGRLEQAASEQARPEQGETNEKAVREAGKPEAAKPIEQETRAQAKEPKAMPYAENMIAVRDDIISDLEKIRQQASGLPVEIQSELHKKTTDYLANWDKGIEAARQREEKIGQIAGEKHVEPQERKFDNYTAFTQQDRGTTVVYAHKRDDGSAGKVAFVDQGQTIKVENWKDRETNLAALQLAAEKWETITVNGPARYQKAVVELAAEHGFRIANPELQDMYNQARERVQERAGSQPGLGGGPAQEAKQEQGAQPPVPTQAAVQVQGEPERQAALNIIREQVGREAARETRQEQVAERQHSPQEPELEARAEAAQSAGRTVDGNPRQAIQVTPATSPEIERLAERQQAIVSQGEAAKSEAKEEKTEQDQKAQVEKPRGGQRM